MFLGPGTQKKPNDTFQTNENKTMKIQHDIGKCLEHGPRRVRQEEKEVLLAGNLGSLYILVQRQRQRLN